MGGGGEVHWRTGEEEIGGCTGGLGRRRRCTGRTGEEEIERRCTGRTGEEEMGGGAQVGLGRSHIGTHLQWLPLGMESKDGCGPMGNEWECGVIGVCVQPCWESDNTMSSIYMHTHTHTCDPCRHTQMM